MANTKTYVTFGQIHRHAIGDTIFDKDCVAVIHHSDQVGGCTLAFEYFGPKFCFEYSEADLDAIDIEFFPRGFVNVNEPLKEEEEEMGMLDPMIDGVVPTPIAVAESEFLGELKDNSDAS